VNVEQRSPTAQTLAWVAQCLGPNRRVIGVSPLRGGITAAMALVTLTGPTGLTRVVLRRWETEDAAREGLVEREVDALHALRGSGVPAPELIGADRDGSVSGARCTLTTAVIGAPDLAPTDPVGWLHQLARTQALIHAVPARVPSRWAGWFDDAAPLHWISDAGLREEARRAAATAQLDRQVGFVHGDYQHFNVLWQDGTLTGVVDWPNAAMAPLGFDVGHCLLNLAVLFSASWADDYLATYERAAGLSIDRQVALRSVLGFGEDWARFIPRQVDGRTVVDIAGMPGRVTELVGRLLAGIG
jgi:aminoglycoside phosphotransferase (APT) family kinase protein